MSNRLNLPFLLLAVFFMAGCSPPASNDTNETANAPAKATAQANQAKAAPPCALSMGWDPWEPYQYRDVDGDVRGLDVELVREIAKQAKCDVRFEEGRWNTLIKRLQEGDIDILAGATRTASRESFARFSVPYREESFQLYVRKTGANKYQNASLRELLENGFRVGVTEQYVYGKLISDLQETPQFADQFIGSTVGALNYSRLLDLKIDGFLDDPFVAARALRNSELGDQISSTPLQIHSGEVNLMFSRASTDDALLKRIDESIATIKADGRHQAIVEKYLR